MVHKLVSNRSTSFAWVGVSDVDTSVEMMSRNAYIDKMTNKLCI